MAVFQYNKTSEEHKTAEFIRMLVRAKQGLNISENDVMRFLVKEDDLLERTRVTKPERRALAYMRLLSDLGGPEWRIMGELADYFDTYAISLDGEQRKEAILMTRAKTNLESSQQNISIGAYPSVETGNKTEKKTHFWNRSKEAKQT